MQIGQQNASIAAYNSQASVNLSDTKQQSAATSATNTALASETDKASATPQQSTVVTLSAEAQALAASDTILQIGNGTGKPPLDP